MQITAAVFREVHQPLTIETVDLDEPRGREVLVRTAATGVCHSDLHIVDGLGRFNLDRPFVLGHEGSGVVEAVGDDVTAVRKGDHVVACLSGFCGTCPQCLSGHPNVCTGGIVGRENRLSQNGQLFQQFANIASYASHMLLHENSLVRIDPDLPLDRAALVGCGVLTGVGAALRSSGLQAGQTVAVFGCGGVGLSIVQGARIGGARQIEEDQGPVHFLQEAAAVLGQPSIAVVPQGQVRQEDRRPGAEAAAVFVHGQPQLPGFLLGMPGDPQKQRHPARHCGHQRRQQPAPGSAG